MERPQAVRMLVLGTVHRCNRNEIAPDRYQGVTNQCGGVYRISDMAHVDDAIFQSLHEVIADRFPDDVVFSLHGQASAGISVSAGLSSAPVAWPGHPMSRFHARLAAGLQPLRGDVANITACSPHAGPFGTQSATILCGARNAQGVRLRDRGRQRHFIHIEMDRASREEAPQVTAFIAAIGGTMESLFGTGFEASDDLQAP